MATQVWETKRRSGVKHICGTGRHRFSFPAQSVLWSLSCSSTPDFTFHLCTCVKERNPILSSTGTTALNTRENVDALIFKKVHRTAGKIRHLREKKTDTSTFIKTHSLPLTNSAPHLTLVWKQTSGVIQKVNVLLLL